MSWKGSAGYRLSPDLRFDPGIVLDGLRNTTILLSQDSRSPGRHLKAGRLKCETGVRRLETNVAIG
jgi:hypothetical protein